jgi:hypothetical protein
MRIITALDDTMLDIRPEPFGRIPFCPPTVCYSGDGGEGTGNNGKSGPQGGTHESQSGFTGYGQSQGLLGSIGPSSQGKSIVETAREQGWKTAKTTGAKQATMGNVNSAGSQAVNTFTDTHSLLSTLLGPLVAVVPASIMALGVLAYNAYGPDPDADTSDAESTGTDAGGDNRQRAAAAAAEETTAESGASAGTVDTAKLQTTIETLGNALRNPWARTLFTSGRGVTRPAPVRRKSLLGA